MKINVYPKAIERAFSKELGWSKIKMALLDGSYIFNKQDEFYYQVMDYEIKGQNYIAGGNLLQDVGFGFEKEYSELFLRWTEVNWENVSFTFRQAVIYSDELNKPLIAYIDFEDFINVENTNLKIACNDGWFIKFILEALEV